MVHSALASPLPRGEPEQRKHTWLNNDSQSLPMCLFISHLELTA